MALVNDDMPVAGDDVVDLLVAKQALDHRDVELAVRLALPAADLTHAFRIDSQEERELRHPLVEQRSPMNEDECAPRALRDDVGADDGLAHARRRDKDAYVMSEHRIRGLLLQGCERPSEHVRQRLAELAPVLDPKRRAILLEERFDVGLTPPRQSHVFG